MALTTWWEDEREGIGFVVGCLDRQALEAEPCEVVVDAVVCAKQLWRSRRSMGAHVESRVVAQDCATEVAHMWCTKWKSR